MLFTSGNQLKQAIREAGVCQWQVAERLGLSEFTFSRKLRHELAGEMWEKVLAAIDQIVAEREGEGN